MHDPLERLYRTKLVLLATLLVAAGILLLFLGNAAEDSGLASWLYGWPINDIGGALFTTGLLGVALQYFDGQDSEARATRRLEAVIANATPAMRDAVIKGFAFAPDDLSGVTTPEVLDRIITNGLALRLSDDAFAEDVAADLRSRAIEPPERLYDARVQIHLSETSGGSHPAMYAVTCRWEFQVVPKYSVRRFLCTSDEGEFRELDQDTAATSAWFLRSGPGIDATRRSTYELLEFTVDGEKRPIRRSQKSSGQTYTVAVGGEQVAAGNPVSIAYTFRTVVAADAHLLQLRIEQPTKGFLAELNYGDTQIDEVRVVDFTASGTKSHLVKPPAGAAPRTVGVETEGWLLARSGVAFVWPSRERRRT